MCYLEYQNFEKPAKIKVNAWFRTEGLEKDANITITLKWLVRESKGANDIKPGWLPDRYGSVFGIWSPKEGEWCQLQSLNVTPDILPCKMSILLGINGSSKGKVFIDDLQVFAE